MLTGSSPDTIYHFIGEPAFEHDFGHIDYEVTEFDERVVYVLYPYRCERRGRGIRDKPTPSNQRHAHGMRMYP
jgi:hypothetical protein